MSEARTNDVAAVTHLEQPMEIVEHLNRSRREGATISGIATVLSDAVSRIEVLGGDDGE